MDYLKRIIDKEIDIKIGAFGAIQLVGPKGCGKTRTASERCQTIIEFQNEDERRDLLDIAATKPSILLSRNKPILLDEWQDAPQMWGAVRNACDKEDLFGAFYLTGSTSKPIDTPHTGTLRISTIEMLPMSLYESKESNGKISLTDLFNNPKFDVTGIESDLTIEELLFACCRGGWPRSLIAKNKASALSVAKDAYKQIRYKDMTSIDGVKRNPDWVDAILKSYARNIATLSKKNVLVRDVISNLSISEDTYDTYVEKLKELYVITDVNAWCPQIRSEKSLRAPKKRMFVDPSIAVAALGVNPDYFLNDFDMFGHIFESLVYRDLLAYSSALGGKFEHYHDKYDLEVDGVLHLEDGRYALIEIKLGLNHIQDGIDNLLKIKKLIKEANMTKKHLPIREPDLLLIITGGKYAKETIDGVKIIPIGCLKD